MLAHFPWTAELDSLVERRAQPRRKGQEIRVIISDFKAQARPVEGLVMDRSPGGLCLSVSKPVAPGTILSVRASTAPALVPWVHVEVVYCNPREDRWVLGCQFAHLVPWSVLVLFG